MATYQITSPDGGTYEVTAPDNASESDVLAYAQQNYKAPKESRPDTTTATDRTLRGLRDPIDGGAQLLTKMLPSSVVSAGNSLNNWLADKTGLVGRLPEGGVDQQVRGNEAAYQAARGDNANSFDGMRLLGNVVNPANLALASRLPAATSLAGRALTGGVGGALTSALNPVTEGDYWTEKAKQVGTGAALGAAVPAVTGSLARVVSPKASLNPDVQMLRNEGVTPTIGQALGGRWNAAEEKAMSLPLMGDMIAVARGKSREEFNNAAINRATAPIQQRVAGSGQDAVREAGDLVSAAYDRARSMLKAFPVDAQARQELSSLQALAQGLPRAERNTINSYFNDYLGNNALTAETFKILDSKLSKDIARFSGSSDAYQQQVGEALKTAQKSITDSAMRANPQAAALMAQADKGWANLVRVEGAAKLAHNAGGVFTPAQLAGGVRGADNSLRDRATARGTALMQDLSRAGQNVLGNKVPDSGTAGRVALGSAAFGSGLLDPTFLATMLTGAGMYTGPMRSLLSGAVTARPQSAQALANAVRQSSPLLIPAGAQAGLSLLN